MPGSTLGFSTIEKRNSLLHIYIDADACPVKDEIYKVAKRYSLSVSVVSNSWMRTPEEDWIELVVVKQGADEADDWIVEQVEENDIVITGDIPLAARCIDKRAKVLGLKGRPFTEENVSDALATRDLLKDLRENGMMTRGPAPFSSKDRSSFLQGLDRIVHSIRREANI